MILHKKRFVGASLVTAALIGPGLANAADTHFQGVASANPRTTGVAVPNILTRELIESVAAQGAMPLDGGNATFPFYGYSGDGPMMPAPNAQQTPGVKIEATKTEPDKNTYLVLENQHGADPGFDYGTHFLFQGHEGGVADPTAGRNMGALTRINLDVDDLEHRVTAIAVSDINGRSLPTIDGSTWYPWAHRLLFTAELGTLGGVWQATPDYPSSVVDISGVTGRGGYEAIQPDSDGNVWIVEDTGGARGTINSHARQPNSFVYRLIPYSKSDLTMGGKLQALQVMSLAHPGTPIIFHPGDADGDILSQDVKDLHTYGLTFQTNWVTLHDTAINGFSPFDANALAKSFLATPFKRPENGMFRPGTHFGQFFFDETGDTDSRTEAGSEFGGFGGIMVLEQDDPSADHGTLHLFFQGDLEICSLDNLVFWDKDQVVVVEDRGDMLHGQANALDSGWSFDADADYGDPTTASPVRVLALGRDASSTLDSGYLAAGGGFQNDGDNEITGIHVSDGDPSIGGILGAKNPHPFSFGWRAFYTQQHGDNVTWELHPAQTTVIENQSVHK